MYFIDDLCVINNGGELGNRFQRSNPPEMELKIEHGGIHETSTCLFLQ